MAQQDTRPKPRIVHLLGDLRLGGTATMALSRVRGCPDLEHHVWAAGRARVVAAGRMEDDPFPALQAVQTSR